jgi:hypothetical protein
MRPSGVYLVEVELGTWRSTAIPQGDLQITLRIGRTVVRQVVTRHF